MKVVVIPEFGKRMDDFSITKSEMKSVIRNPDKSSCLELHPGVKRCLAIKKQNSHHIIVDYMELEDKFEIWGGYKITDSLYDEINDSEIIQIFENFLEKFGIEFSFHNFTGRLIVNDTFQTDNQLTQQNAFSFVPTAVFFPNITKAQTN